MPTFPRTARFGVPIALLLTSACANLPVGSASAGASKEDLRMIEERVAQIPVCSSMGMPSIAFMVPPHEELATFRLTIAAAVPEGVALEFFYPNQAPPLLDRVRAQHGLGKLLRGFSRMEGAAVTVMLLDETGKVSRVEPNSGDRELDRRLRMFWKEQRFLPYRYNGCRSPAWIRVETSFETSPSTIYSQLHYPAIDWRRVREAEDLWSIIDL